MLLEFAELFAVLAFLCGLAVEHLHSLDGIDGLLGEGAGLGVDFFVLVVAALVAVHVEVADQHYERKHSQTDDREQPCGHKDEND